MADPGRQISHPNRRIPPDPAEPELRELRRGDPFGPYRIERKLGGGGMGIVFLAREAAMRRFVALKVLRQTPKRHDDTAIRQFLEEMHLLAEFEHPGIVRIYDAGAFRGNPYFTMEAVDGEDLKKVLARHGMLPPEQVLEIACQTAEILSYAWNRAAMVHRDIKPANLMWTPEKTVKLLDLGISRCFSRLEDPDCGRDGYIAGSPHYLAPEQALNRPDMDFRADLYSLGITLFHLLTGKVPFDGPNPREIIRRQISQTLPEPRIYRGDVCSEFVSLIQRMTAKNPEDRFDSYEAFLKQADSVRTAQRRFSAEGGAALSGNSRMDSPRRASAFRRGILSGVFLLLLFAGIGVSGALWIRHFTGKPASMRETLLDPVRKESYFLEASGKYRQALRCWTDLQLPPEYAQDPVIEQEIRTSIEYLKQRIKDSSDPE